MSTAPAPTPSSSSPSAASTGARGCAPPVGPTQRDPRRGIGAAASPGCAGQALTLCLGGAWLCVPREAEPCGPGGLGAGRAVGRGGQPAPRGAAHQQVPLSAGRRHLCPALTAGPRALPQLQADLPAAGLTQRRQQDPHDGAGRGWAHSR